MKDVGYEAFAQGQLFGKIGGPEFFFLHQVFQQLDGICFREGIVLFIIFFDEKGEQFDGILLRPGFLLCPIRTPKGRTSTRKG